MDRSLLDPSNRDAAPHRQQAPGPSTMLAVVMHGFGDPDVLRVEQVPTPDAVPGEVVARIAAVEVSRTRDLGTRSGRHPFSRAVTLPHVLGGDCAGTVVAVGAGVHQALVGRRVGIMNHHTCGQCDACRAGRDDHCSALRMLGIHRWGSYAEYASVWVDSVHLIPDDLPFTEAAAMAATGPVAATQLVAAGVRADDHLLVTGLAGALASMLAALADRLGVHVIGLTRRPDLVPTGSCSAVLDSSSPRLTDDILAATGGDPPRAAIDNVCTPDVFDAYFPTLAHGARVVVSGAIAAPVMPVLSVPARDLYSRSIAVVGIRSHSVPATERFWRDVQEGFRLPPAQLNVEPFTRAADVHRAVADLRTAGHTLLTLAGQLTPPGAVR